MMDENHNDSLFAIQLRYLMSSGQYEAASNKMMEKFEKIETLLLQVLNEIDKLKGKV